MIIKRRRKVPKTLSLKKTKKKPGTVIIETEQEIPDELLDKLLGVISEVFARNKEHRESGAPLEFPAFPNPFFQEVRDFKKEKVKSIGWNNNPLKFWFKETIEATLKERIFLIEKLAELGALGITAKPTPELTDALDFKISLEVNLESLAKLYAEIEKYQEEIKKNLGYDLGSWDYEKKLFFLRESYQMLIKILDAVGGTGFVIISNPNLNYFYTVLCGIVDGILTQKEFSELVKTKPEIYESLVGDISEMDVTWQEVIKKEMLNFFGSIEKLYIKAAMPQVELEKHFLTFFKKADEEIERHLAEVHKASVQFEEKTKRLAEEYKQQMAGKPEESPKDTPEERRGATKEEEKFHFYSETGDAEYKGETACFNEGTKGRVLLHFFMENPHSPFSIEDIKQHCNPKVFKEGHKFRAEKDIDDTVALIRNKLKIKRGAYFPLQKRMKNKQPHWILLQK